MDHIFNNEEETLLFAKEYAKSLRGGDILALYGDLGAGKTTFVKGLAKALGVCSEITSPTFVVLKEYQIEKKDRPSNMKSVGNLVHVDCYRFGSIEDSQSVGLEEYFTRSDIVTVIEWPEKIEEILPPRSKKLEFSYLDENSRKVSHR